MKRLVFALASVALLACGGSDSTGPFVSAEGTWNLLSVDGHPLPYTFFTQASPPVQDEIVSDQYVLDANHNYTDAFTIRETAGTDVTDDPGSDNGTWSQSGNRIDFDSADPQVSVPSATINGTGDLITFNVNGILLVYAKQ
jgi:hypothetical protein